MKPFQGILKEIQEKINYRMSKEETLFWLVYTLSGDTKAFGFENILEDTPNNLRNVNQQLR